MSWGFSSLVNSVSALVNPEPQIAVNGEDKIKQAAEQALVDLQNSPPFFTRMQGPEACFEYYRQRIFTVLKGSFDSYQIIEIDNEIANLKQKEKDPTISQEEKEATANTINTLIDKTKIIKKNLDYSSFCHQVLNGLYLGQNTAAVQATQRFYFYPPTMEAKEQEKINPYGFRNIISLCSIEHIFRDLDDETSADGLRKTFHNNCKSNDIRWIDLSAGLLDLPWVELVYNNICFNHSDDLLFSKTEEKSIKEELIKKTFVMNYFTKTFAVLDRAVMGELTLVHCKEGISRSAAIVVLYLIFRFDLTPKQALKYLKLMRPTISAVEEKFYSFFVTFSKEIRMAKLKKEVEEVVKASKARDVARKDSNAHFDQICGDLYLGDSDGFNSVCPADISLENLSPDNCNPVKFESLITLVKVELMFFDIRQLSEVDKKIEKLGIDWTCIAATLASNSRYWPSLVYNSTMSDEISRQDPERTNEKNLVLETKNDWLNKTDVKEWFQLIFAKFEEAFFEGRKTLVHCGSGKTSSPALLIAFFIHLGFSYEDAAIFIGSKRRVELAPFANHLKAYEVALRRDVPYKKALAAVELTCNE